MFPVRLRRARIQNIMAHVHRDTAVVKASTSQMPFSDSVPRGITTHKVVSQFNIQLFGLGAAVIKRRVFLTQNLYIHSFKQHNASRLHDDSAGKVPAAFL